MGFIKKLMHFKRDTEDKICIGKENFGCSHANKT